MSERGPHDGGASPDERSAPPSAEASTGGGQALSRRIEVRRTRPADFAAIARMSAEVYGLGWQPRELASHLEVFPRGQLVAVLGDEVVGMAASLIVSWDDYEIEQSWRDFTDHGMFTNHDAGGRTLYGAEVMVSPHLQRRGVGRALYAARRELVRELGLLRIRAGARLRGYHRLRDEIGPAEYVRRVSAGTLTDPTLSFQLREGFQVLSVVSDYLRFDDESHGWAAIIEWRNDAL